MDYPSPHEDQENGIPESLSGEIPIYVDNLSDVTTAFQEDQWSTRSLSQRQWDNLAQFIEWLEATESNTIWKLASIFEDRLRRDVYYPNPGPLIADGQYNNISRQFLQNTLDSNSILLEHECFSNTELKKSIQNLLYRLHVVNESLKTMARLLDGQDRTWTHDTHSVRSMLILLRVLVPFLLENFAGMWFDWDLD
ncbi:hypothetical protein FVEG_15980 [Fusarium verticillioides 7600]|uniref:Uncharacterized protein n=1 Tax=Gibberella moniliformis (strain M3125 / FGSC 7600) TaxID=334819 RepID=W7M4Q3_GIBM7|nr:hypothetical protein FVEG_15980 [Fusarium verticillioides 7600]EWG46553.1 hypothetical protein FVEG_15980 [Fusarium verticillioides 7600]